MTTQPAMGGPAMRRAPGSQIGPQAGPARARGPVVAADAPRSLGRNVTLVLGCLMGLSIWNAWGPDIGIQQLPVGQAFLYLFSLSALTVGRAPSTYRRRTPYFLPLLLAVITILLLVLVSSAYASEPMNSLRYAARYVQGFLLILGVSVYKPSLREIKVLALCFAAGSVVCGIITVVGSRVPALGHYTMGEGGIVGTAQGDNVSAHRARGPYAYTNELGLAMAMAAPLAISYLKIRRPYWLIAFGIIMYSELLSGSKINCLLIGALVAVYFVGLNLARRKFVMTAGYIAVAAIVPPLLAGALLAYTKASNPHYYSELTGFISDPNRSGTTTGRLEIWSTVIHNFTGGAYFGVGAGNIDTLVWAVHAHNVFLEFLGGLGVPGVLALLFFLGVVFVIGIRALKVAGKIANIDPDACKLIISLQLAVLSYIISSQVSDSFGSQTLQLLWVSIAFTVALLGAAAYSRSAGPQLSRAAKPASRDPEQERSLHEAQMARLRAGVQPEREGST